MENRMLQPYEPEEMSLDWPLSWPFQRWPLMKSLLQQKSDLSVWEEKDEVIVEAALPGIKKGEVELTFERGILTVRGEKKEEKEDKDRKYFQKSTSSFLYRLNIPGDIDEGQEPQAKLHEGILQVRFKKQKKKNPRKINVQGN